MKRGVRLCASIGLAVLIGMGLLAPEVAVAQDALGDLGAAAGDLMGGADPEAASSAVRLIVLLTVLSLLPALLLAMTPFTRFIIVFSLLRQALGLQQSPPNQVLIGLALVLSMVVMQPTLNQVYDEAVSPYLEGELSTQEAYDLGLAPMRTFMLRNVERDDLATAIRLARMTRPDGLDGIPTPVVMTGFLLSELKAAFVIAVKVYIPFLVVDVVVASSLLGMGMMMLPPVVISLPFKLMVFVLMDGWGLLLTGMVGGVR